MKSHLALITILDGSGLGLRPDNTLPPAFGGRPDQGLPEHPVDPGFGVGAPPVDPGYGLGHPWLRPDNSLPGERPPHISTGPVPPPVTPDNTLPPTAPPPTASLPIVLPPGETVPNDALFELKYSVRFGWVLVPVKDPEAAPKY